MHHVMDMKGKRAGLSLTVSAIINRFNSAFNVTESAENEEVQNRDGLKCCCFLFTYTYN